jgi:predicted PurR-regulated permease PerM
MDLIKLDKKQQKILYVLTFIALFAGFYFLRSYMMLIIFAAIMATLFSPVNAYFLRKGKSDTTASIYTFMISMFSIIIPLLFVVAITVYQINSLVSDIDTTTYSSANVNVLLDNVVAWVNELIVRFGGTATLTTEQILETFSASISEFGKVLIENIVNSFAGIFGLITAGIIYIYVFMSLLKNKNVIKETIRKLNPLGDEVTSLYINRADAMTKATVRGQFIIAVMQGLTSAVVLAAVGLNELFFFFFLLLSVFSVIPLGAGIITIPIGIGMILVGNIWQGTVVILNHLLLVTNIDNVMRPKLVPKSARLDPALMILAVFSGIALYGFLGIVIGPIIMILITTTVQIYKEVFFKEASIDRSKDNTTKSFSRVRGITKKASDKIGDLLD